MAIANYGKWKAKKGVFEVYNKEFDKKLEHKPDEFILLDEYSTIGGWDVKGNTGIYSNNFRNVKEEELSVRTKNGEIFKGQYNKEAIEAIGGVFTRVIIVFENGEINEYKFTGKAIMHYGDARKELTPAKTFVKYDGAVKDGLNHKPVFINGSIISDKIKEEAKTAFDTYKKEIEEKKEASVNKNPDNELPF